ncbi:MAG: DUF305 domain-containing protein [Acidimicrobiales bacterium]
MTDVASDQDQAAAGVATDASASTAEERPGVASRFGPLTPLRVVVLLVAVAFLAGTVGWAVSERTRDPLNEVDVGFMQDMGYHHDQAVQMSLLLLAKPDVPRDLRGFAQEIIMDQRFEQGVFNAILDRFGYPAEPGETVMDWMDTPLPRDSMEGLATDEQMQQLRDAEGSEAQALWISLMSEHHLAGLHMADWAARHGHDATVRNLARSMVRSQRSEVLDLDRFRRREGLPLAEGFGDPTKDQRLNPLSLADG